MVRESSDRLSLFEGLELKVCVRSLMYEEYGQGSE